MNLKPLFEPKAMAVIGVSLSNERHPATVVYSKNHLRGPVEVYAVNPKGGKLHGETIYPSVKDIPRKIDLAAIVTRADLTPNVMIDCIEAGVKSAIVISGGFTERGREDLQNRLVDIAREAQFPFIGPNCLGIYVPSRVDTFSAPIERMVQPRAGGVAFVSQSGGIAIDQMIKFVSHGVGVSKMVSIGNKALIREKEMLDYLIKDPTTKVIAYYVEGFSPGEGREFVLAAKHSPKPVIMLKAGKTEAGNRAVTSHTASLAGDYASFSSVMAQHHILEAASENELASFCAALNSYKTAIAGNIGIITCSGGHGAIAVDGCTLAGLNVPELSEQSMAEMRDNLTESVRYIASLNNPADLTGSAVDDDVVACAKVMAATPELDCVIVLMLPYTPGISLDIGAKLSSLSKKFGKPFIAYVPHMERYDMLIEGFQMNGIPVSPSIEGVVLMAKALARKKPC